MNIRILNPSTTNMCQRMRDALRLCKHIKNSLILPICCRLTSTSSNSMNVFDRKAKRLQKNRTALLKDYAVYDYVKEEVGWRMADRICDIKRKFNIAVDLGCGRGHVSKHVYSDMVGTLYQCDMAEDVLAQSEVSPEVPTFKIHADEEFLPFKDNSIDLFVSSLSLHWVNDLPATFRQVFNALKNDGAFLGCMFGSDTLFEFRGVYQLAETELEGGFSSHVSPFVDVNDLGNLLGTAKFTLLTMDYDEMVINYPSMFELLHDLKGMGENNCAWKRRLRLNRGTMKLAAEKYKEMHGNEDGSVPATFQIIYFIGWKPDPSQSKPAKRGSGQVSIQDIDKLDKMIKEIDTLASKDPDKKS